MVRPDGHGVWHDGGRPTPFWLEADRGTETLSRVVGKLTGYAALPPSRAYPVLFWFTTAAREVNFHAYLTRAGVPDGVSVATGAADTGGPADPVWRLAGLGGRVSIGDLASAEGSRRWPELQKVDEFPDLPEAERRWPRVTGPAQTAGVGLALPGCA